MKAFVRCGMAEREKTIQLIKNNRPSADVNERDYRYCNCIIEEIEQAIKSSLDIAMTLPEVKKFLKKAKSTANV